MPRFPSRIILPVALSCLLLAAMPAQAPAQEGTRPSPYALEPVTVTARGFGAQVSRTPGGVGVVDSEEIAETDPVSVTNVLARVPGVDLSSDSPWGSDIVIRGSSRDSVVFLIDGNRVNVTTDINGRFGLINPEDIERVEVLKGPVSVLYGSGSTGGVVNIITKKGRFTDAPEWHGGLALGGSTNPAGADTALNLSYNSPSAWLYGSGAWRDHGNSFSGGGQVIPNSQYEDFYGKLAGGYKWNDLQTSEIQYQHLDGSEIGIPGKGTSTLPSNADVTLAHNDRRLVDFTHTFRPEDSALKESVLKLSYQLLVRNPRIDNFTSGTNLWLKPSADHETLSANWRNRLELGDHTLVAGLEAWNWYMVSTRDKMTTGGVLTTDKPTPDTNQLSTGVFAEDDWKLSEAWTLNVGARLDRMAIDARNATLSDDREDYSWAGHLGLTWLFAKDWSMTGLAAASYRAPNILERYKNIALGGGVSEIGDPGLKPERSNFFEYGLHYTGQTLRSTTSLYANFVDDYISSQQISATLYQMANVSKAEIYGAEQELEWDFAQGWTAYGNVAYAEGRDVSTGQWLRFVAPLNGLVGVRQRLDSGFWWAVEDEWAAEQGNVPSGTAKGEAWNTVNVRGGYDFLVSGLRNEVVVGVTNLCDTSYHNYLATSRGIELREPGVGLYATWRLSF